ncbi:hypothetical protein [Sessilibacter corallicola]|uniref:hypothetical protein n=1 Tax=Sessilibacter corallicola TaxID=2904075 RepID=UPI001E29B15E|nr:hypothetical protein [Sessilibacter corallicola]MCE2030373.1 hypothetical protein [Sessilibacter corallicola]
MTDFWVIDTKCKVSPESGLPQDGSDFYYGRSVVPAENKDIAITKLRKLLESHKIVIDSVLESITYENGNWDDDEFDIHHSHEESKAENSIELGCFLSENSHCQSCNK